MDFDDIGWGAYQETVMQWAERCRNSSEGICELAGRYRKRDDCWLLSIHRGSYNFGFRLYWEDGGEDWLVRFPIPGKSMFLEEKIYNEVALMKYIAANTQIPVPRVVWLRKGRGEPHWRWPIYHNNLSGGKADVRDTPEGERVRRGR